MYQSIELTEFAGRLHRMGIIDLNVRKALVDAFIRDIGWHDPRRVRAMVHNDAVG